MIAYIRETRRRFRRACRILGHDPGTVEILLLNAFLARIRAETIRAGETARRHIRMAINVKKGGARKAAAEKEPVAVEVEDAFTEAGDLDLDDLGLSGEELRELVTGEEEAFSGVEAEVLGTLVERLEELKVLLQTGTKRGDKAFDEMLEVMAATRADVKELREDMLSLKETFAAVTAGAPSASAPAPKASNGSSQVAALMAGVAKGKRFPAAALAARIAAKTGMAVGDVQAALSEGGWLKGDIVLT